MSNTTVSGVSRDGGRHVPNTTSSEQTLTRVCRFHWKLRRGEDGTHDSDHREIWEVTHVREEDLETTESKGVDFLSELLELEG